MSGGLPRFRDHFFGEEHRSDLPHRDHHAVAIGRGLSLLRTTQLYRAIVECQRDNLDVTAFWERVSAGSGNCDLPELE